MTIYGPGVINRRASMQGQVTVRAFTVAGAKRKARRWYSRMKPGAVVYDVWEQTEP